MKIIQLQYFAEVVKTNNISKAAKNLYVSQPAISAAIRELEKEFNTSLFIRYNNQITLTDEGHYLYRLTMGLLDNYEKVKSDMFAEFKGKFNVIISNPPYIPSQDISLLSDEVRKYDPLLALDGGEDGLDFYRRIAEEAGKYLTRGGMLIMEVGEGEAAQVVKLFTNCNYSIIVKDFNGIDRYVKIVM